MPPRTLNQLAEAVSTAPQAAIRLFVVARKLAPGRRTSEKDIYRYAFSALSVGIDGEIKAHAQNLLVRQLRADADEMLRPFEVIDDNESTVSFLDTVDLDFPFLQLVRGHLTDWGAIPPATDFRDLAASLWGYVFAFPLLDGNVLYTVTKSNMGKVGLDIRDADHVSRMRRFTAQFDSEARRLELLKGPVLTFEKTAAAVYLDECFYILNRSSFEQVAGLEDYFEQSVSTVVERLELTERVAGLEFLAVRARQSKRLLKRISHLLRSEDYTTISPERLERMTELAQARNLPFHVEDGVIQVRNEKDVDVLVPLLDDSYLDSFQTGFSYLSSAKRRI